MRQSASSIKFALLAVAAIVAVLPAGAQAATDPALVFHATQAGVFTQADVNGITIAVNVRSQSYRFSGGNTRPDFDAISVDITLTDDATGTLIAGFDGFVPGSGTVAPNLSTATIPTTTVQLQEFFGGDDQATVTVSAQIVATGDATHTHFIARFCGPPQPCFGMFNIDGTEQQGTAVLTIGGVVDGIDLGEVTFSSLSAVMSSLLGVELLG